LQSGRRDAEGVRHQQPCVETRIVDAGLAQEGRGLVECFKRRDGGTDQVLGQAVGLAARFAWLRSSLRLRARAPTVRRVLGVASR
jgi:hypothetical protein